MYVVKEHKLCRQVGYDFLRAISCMTVIILHVSSMYLKDDFRGLISNRSYHFAAFYCVMSNMAVPSFIMISGAFLLTEKNKEYGRFYKKNLRKILIPTMVFSLAYLLMHYCEIIMAVFMGVGVSSDRLDYTSPLKNFIIGKPHITMWFMFMILGLYVVTPVIVRIKESITAKQWTILGVALFVYGIIVRYSCSLSWVLQWSMWIGYFAMGNVLAEWLKGKENRALGVLLVVIAYAANVVYWYMYTFNTSTLTIPDSFSVCVLVSTLLQFVGIALLGLKKQPWLLDLISKYSFGVYLLHPFFTEFLQQLCGRIIKKFLTGILIPLYAFCIAFVCCILVGLYHAWWQKVRKGA